MLEKPHTLKSSTGYWVTRLARAFEADLEQRLAEYEVTRASWAVLSAIHHHEKNAPASLASFIGIDRAAITRHLDRLEKQGLIQRNQSATDRRVVNVALTSNGTSLVSELAAESVATNAKFTAGLTHSEIEALQAILSKMLSNSDVGVADI